MSTPEVRLGPIGYAPISDKEGRPTSFFARQWDFLVDLVKRVFAQQQEIVALQGDAATLRATQIGGDGTDITPAPAPLSAGDISLTLTTTGVTAGTYGNATNVPQIVVDEKGRIESAANVPISGGGSLVTQDEGTTVVPATTTMNFVGAGVTVTSPSAGVAEVSIPGGGGGGFGWTLISNTNITTPQANFDFTGLGAYNELMIITNNITKVAAAATVLRVSTDNGATYFAGAADYTRIVDSGAITTRADILLHDTALATARGGVGILTGLQTTVGKMFFGQSVGIGLFTASTAAVNAIRITTPIGTNLTAGTITIYAR